MSLNLFNWQTFHHPSEFIVALINKIVFIFQWVGSSCGRHGSYVFYKAFRFSLHNQQRAANNVPKVRSRTRDRRTQSSSSQNESSSDNNNGDANAVKDNTSSDDRILGLGDFFFVQCRPEDPVCVGELQLLWHDKHSGQDLSSTRLYYLPETTPAGRMSAHGEVSALFYLSKSIRSLSLNHVVVCRNFSHQDYSEE